MARYVYVKKGPIKTEGLVDNKKNTQGEEKHYFMNFCSTTERWVDILGRDLMQWF